MNRFKYIFIISLIALFSSCAEDEVISMGSLKIDTQVTNITTTSVLIEFTQPADAVPLYIYYVLLYDENGNPVTVDNDGYYYGYYGNLLENNAIEAMAGECCIIQDLKANTKYTYKIGVREEGNRSVNNSIDDDYLNIICLSDPSYTFTTGDPDMSDNILSARITSVQSYDTSIVVTVRFNENLGGSYGDFNCYLSENEGGLDYVSYSSYFGDNVVEFGFYDIKPGTKYYMTIKGNFLYDAETSSGYWMQYELKDVTLQLTPNYIEIPDTSEILAASITNVTSFDYYTVMSVKLNDNLSNGELYSVSLSGNEDGSDYISDVYYGANAERGSKDIVIEFFGDGIKSNTKYYPIIYGCFEYATTKYGYEYSTTINATLQLTPNYFVTPDDYSSFLSAIITNVTYTDSKVVVEVTLNENLSFESLYGSYLSENEDASNGIWYHSCSGKSGDRIFEVEFYRSDLKSNTDYYLTVNGQFKYTTTINGSEFSKIVYVNNLDLTPKYFVTPNFTEN